MRRTYYMLYEEKRKAVVFYHWFLSTNADLELKIDKTHNCVHTGCKQQTKKLSKHCYTKLLHYQASIVLQRQNLPHLAG